MLIKRNVGTYLDAFNIGSTDIAVFIKFCTGKRIRISGVMAGEFIFKIRIKQGYRRIGAAIVMIDNTNRKSHRRPLL